MGRMDGDRAWKGFAPRMSGLVRGSDREGAARLSGGQGAGRRG
jgi:hypothetical protein